MQLIIQSEITFKNTPITAKPLPSITASSKVGYTTAFQCTKCSWNTNEWEISTCRLHGNGSKKFDFWSLLHSVLGNLQHCSQLLQKSGSTKMKTKVFLENNGTALLFWWLYIFFKKFFFFLQVLVILLMLSELRHVSDLQQETLRRYICWKLFPSLILFFLPTLMTWSVPSCQFRI